MRIRAILALLVVSLGAIIAPLGAKAAEPDSFTVQDYCGNSNYQFSITNPNWYELTPMWGCDESISNTWIGLACSNSNDSDVWIDGTAQVDGSLLSASLRCRHSYSAEPSGQLRYRHLECRDRSGFIGASYDIWTYSSRGSSRVTLSCPRGFRLYHHAK